MDLVDWESGGLQPAVISFGRAWNDGGNDKSQVARQ